MARRKTEQPRDLRGRYAKQYKHVPFEAKAAAGELIPRCWRWWWFLMIAIYILALVPIVAVFIMEQL